MVNFSYFAKIVHFTINYKESKIMHQWVRTNICCTLGGVECVQQLLIIIKDLNLRNTTSTVKIIKFKHDNIFRFLVQHYIIIRGSFILMVFMARKAQGVDRRSSLKDSNRNLGLVTHN